MSKYENIIEKFNMEIAESLSLDFKSAAEIKNVVFTGNEEKDSAILDAIMDFIYDDGTSMSDKVDAAKVMAVYFGEDPGEINAAYVQEMLDDPGEEEEGEDYEDDSDEGDEPWETAKWFKPKRNRMNMKKAIKEVASTSKQWFGAPKFEDKQMLVGGRLTDLLKKPAKRAKEKASALQSFNIETALSIVSKIAKSTGVKTKIVNKQKFPSGKVEIAFTIKGDALIENYVSDFVNLSQNKDKVFTLTVGV